VQLGMLVVLEVPAHAAGRGEHLQPRRLRRMHRVGTWRRHRRIALEDAVAWHIKPETSDPLAHLTGAVEKNRVSGSLSDLLPEHREYTSLRDALAEYRRMLENGGWPEVPANLRLKPGQTHPAVPTLARRLRPAATTPAAS
jgi:murein L,D-transpeptidase YcbB/YkuD